MEEYVQNFDSWYDARMEKQNLCQKLFSQDIQKVRDLIKYRTENPFEKIKIDGINKTYHSEFMLHFNEQNKRNFVYTESFREDSKQWKMAYDPFV